MPSFEAVLRLDSAPGSGTWVQVPPHLNELMHLRGLPKIRAVIAGQPYRGSLRPMGDGTYGLGLLKSIQQAAGVKPGDKITVELELDTAPRTVSPPHDLARHLAVDTDAAARWNDLSYTKQKEMARSLEEAKKPETRARRLAAAIEKLNS